MKTRNGIREIPWPAKVETLPKDEHGQIVVGAFVVWENHDGTWAYGYAEDGLAEGTDFATAYDAVNDGVLCDDYQGSIR